MICNIFNSSTYCFFSTAPCTPRSLEWSIGHPGYSTSLSPARRGRGLYWVSCARVQLHERRLSLSKYIYTKSKYSLSNDFLSSMWRHSLQNNFFKYFWYLCTDINLYNEKYADVDVHLISSFKVNFLIMRKISNSEGSSYICCK